MRLISRVLGDLLLGYWFRRLWRLKVRGRPGARETQVLHHRHLAPAQTWAPVDNQKNSESYGPSESGHGFSAKGRLTVRASCTIHNT